MAQIITLLLWLVLAGFAGYQYGINMDKNISTPAAVAEPVVNEIAVPPIEPPAPTIIIVEGKGQKEAVIPENTVQEVLHEIKISFPELELPEGVAEDTFVYIDPEGKRHETPRYYSKKDGSAIRRTPRVFQKELPIGNQSSEQLAKAEKKCDGPNVKNVRTGKSVTLSDGCQGFVPDGY